MTTSGEPWPIPLLVKLTNRWRTAVGAVIAVSFVASLAIVWALRAFPNSADEYGYLYEARTFLAGRIWNPLPPLPGVFSFLHVFEKEGKWVSEYPFGWSAPLALAGLVHLPFWLVCPIMGAALLFTVATLAQRQNGKLGAILALVLMAFTPFFLFNSASYFNMVPTALGGALFCLGGLEFLEEPNIQRGLLTGAALGWVGVTRTYDVLIFLVPFAVQFLRDARNRHYRFIPAIALGGAPFLLGLLIYNHAITGSAFLPVAKWGYPKFTLGLYPSDDVGNRSNPAIQLFIVIFNIRDLANWSSPLLVAGYLAGLLTNIIKRRFTFLDMIFPAAVVAYFFLIGYGGNRYGPRYYFVGYPFLVLTIVSLLEPIVCNKEHARLALLAVGLAVGHLILCVSADIRLAIFFRGVVNERMDVFDQSSAERLHNAVVIVHSAGGQYLPFTPKDLTRNGIAIDHQPVIYALDVGHVIPELRALFPDRKIYLYSRTGSELKGTLRSVS